MSLLRQTKEVHHIIYTLITLACVPCSDLNVQFVPVSFSLYFQYIYLEQGLSFLAPLNYGTITLSVARAGSASVLLSSCELQILTAAGTFFFLMPMGKSGAQAYPPRFKTT